MSLDFDGLEVDEAKVPKEDAEDFIGRCRWCDRRCGCGNICRKCWAERYGYEDDN